MDGTENGRYADDAAEADAETETLWAGFRASLYPDLSGVRYWKDPEDRDAGAVVLFLPFGLYLIFTKEICICG